MKFLFAVLFLIFIGCGYKPISALANSILDDEIWVDVIVSKIEPQNSLIIKDAIREGMKQRLGKDFAPKELANTKIIASIKSLEFSPMIYDAYGYASTYNAKLTLNYKITFKNGETKNFIATGEHNFKAVRLMKNVRDTNSAINEKDKFLSLIHI